MESAEKMSRDNCRVDGEERKRPETADNRVMIVEDDLALRPVITRAIEQIDTSIHVDWELSGEAALRHLEERGRGVEPEDIDQKVTHIGKYRKAQPYRLIVADVFLDGAVTGIDFWNYCQREYPQIPVVVTSALPVGEFLHRMEKHNMQVPTFLSKPLSLKSFIDTIEPLLRGERPNPSGPQTRQ